MIRVGLLGLGFIGKNHFNQYPKLTQHGQLTAVCDADAARRRGDWTNVGGNIADTAGRVVDLSRYKTYEAWQDLVADDEIDAIDITLPTFLHAPVAIAALEAGKHVLCEKPMAMTVEECDRMIAAARAADRVLMIAQCIRFWPEYVWLKGIADQKKYGQLRAISLWRRAARPDYSYGNWLHDATKSGGAILDLHVHDIDFAIHLLGNPESVHSAGYYRDGALDRVQTLWHYDREPVVYIEGFWDMPAGFGFTMGYHASFDDAGIQWDFASGTPPRIYRHNRDPQDADVPEGDAYAGEITYFLRCIADGRQPTQSTPQESRDAVLIAAAEQRSIDIGTPVPVE